MPNALGDLLARMQAAANLLGRLTLLRDAVPKADEPLQLATTSQLQAFADPPRAPDQEIKIYTSFDLPPTGAAEYIRGLTPVTRSIFDGLTAQYRNDAFTMAGIADTNLLSRIRDVLGEIIQSGGTQAQFQKAVRALTTDAGVEAIAATELDTVFQTMAHKAYMAGRYEQLTEPSLKRALPFWEYWTVGDDRVRPEHAALNSFVALADDPVWRKIFPPSGYNCRCSVAAISRREAPEGSDDPGLMRLPAIAVAKVPQKGFQTLLAP